MSAFLSPVEPAVQDISPASHVPLPWRFGEPRAVAGAKGSHVATYATWKNPLSKHAAPALRRGDRMPLRGKRAKVRSHMTTLRGKAREGRSHLSPLWEKAREGEESPDAPAREKRVKARSHLMP